MARYSDSRRKSIVAAARALAAFVKDEGDASLDRAASIAAEHEITDREQVCILAGIFAANATHGGTPMKN